MELNSSSQAQAQQLPQHTYSIDRLGALVSVLVNRVDGGLGDPQVAAHHTAYHFGLHRIIASLPPQPGICASGEGAQAALAVTNGNPEHQSQDRAESPVAKLENSRHRPQPL